MRQPSGDELAHVSALIVRDGCEARKRSAIRSDDMSRVADNETIGMAGN